MKCVLRFCLAMAIAIVATAVRLPACAAEHESLSPIKAFCIDFNWGPKGINGFAGSGVWADASPEEHVQWYEGLGANVIQTFAVSCNGYAWYKGGGVPPQPGLKYDFLTEMVRLGHAKGMRVMGYFCVGANTLWGQQHPDLSYGTPSAPHVPLTTAYLDYLCGSMEDALKRTGMDGFMIDWVWNPERRQPGQQKDAPERWLACEKAMYAELMGQPFPGEAKLSPAEQAAYERRAIDRCWMRIYTAAKRANPKCIIWLSCNNLKHPSVVGSHMFRQIDWLMNEHPDPTSITAAAKMAGPQTQLVQCLVGWGDQHDAPKVLADPEFRKLGIYGFAAPGVNSLPLPIAQYRSKPVGAFRGNDKNIAVLLRYFHGLPFDYVEPHSSREFYEWANIWIPEATGTKLPRVLLIGDSITFGYYQAVADKLQSKASVARLTTSKAVGDPALLTEVALVLDQCRFDVVHFNNGLHGWGYSEAEYQQHFPQLIATIRKHAPKAKLIWATITPMRTAKDLSVVAEGTKRVQARNKIAAEIVSKEGIAVDDLYGLVKDHTDYWSPDGVHFNAKGVAVEAEQVTKRIKNSLK
jgi:hypothetical protein